MQPGLGFAIYNTKEELETMALLQIPDGQLDYTSGGSGSPACLAYQYAPVSVEESIAEGAPLAQMLTPFFTCYAINARAIGGSGPVRGPQDLTMAGLADDLEAARHRLGCGPWVVVGHSTGGMVALIYACRYPHALSGLILIGTAASHRFLEGSLFNPQHPHALELARANQALMGGTPEGRAYWEETLWSLSVADPERTPLPRQGFFSGFSYQRSMAFVNELSHFDLEDNLPQIHVPTLVIGGRSDPQAPLENSERIAAALPGAHLVICEHSGHFPYIEEPGVVRQAVRWFATVNRFGGAG
jgi:proline iminopeptidase